jgi:K+-sensing histidine kinase KdpD
MTDPLSHRSTPTSHLRTPFSTEDSRFFSREEGLIPIIVIFVLSSFSFCLSGFFSVFLVSILFILGLLLIDFIYSFILGLLHIVFLSFWLYIAFDLRQHPLST